MGNLYVKYLFNRNMWMPIIHGDAMEISMYIYTFICPNPDAPHGIYIYTYNLAMVHMIKKRKLHIWRLKKKHRN